MSIRRSRTPIFMAARGKGLPMRLFGMMIVLAVLISAIAIVSNSDSCSAGY